MMMPEQNEKVRGRDEQVTSESEYPRAERTDYESDETRAEQTRSEQTRAEGAGYESMPSDETRAEQMQSEQMQSEQMQSEQTRSGQMPAGQQTAPEDGERERLVPEDHAASYGSRWDAVKGTFVDEPREAVAQADALVGELLEELETLFREQRRSIEHGLDTDETSTEDLRMALRRYRSFFERLLAV